jgi:hypothetical protein
MEWNEIKILFPSLTDCTKDLVMDVTGGVPLQVSNLMKAGLDVDQYKIIESQSIRSSLEKLEADFTKKGLPRHFEIIKRSAIASVVGRPGDLLDYDRKYLVPCHRYSEYFVPLFPLVLSVYQEYFWNDILALYGESEASCLSTCAYPRATNELRCRLLAIIVIDRCTHNSLQLLSTEDDGTVDATTDAAEFPGLLPCEPVKFNSTMTLPLFETLLEDGLYVPFRYNFPAVDTIWKMGDVTWFVKVHVNREASNMLPTLKAMCQQAGWQGKMYYLYLSPEKKVTELLPKHFLAPESNPDITVKALSIKSFSCLSTIRWPEGCSLG